MSLSAKIREQIISSFRAELSEHIQTMTQGLLALEQNKLSGGEREETLTNIFRAAHSLKGAARAVSVTAIEQLAHALEDVLGGMQRGEFQPTSGLFTACYQALDAIQATQSAYEAGQTSPPPQALEALVNLDILQKLPASANPGEALVDPKAEAALAGQDQIRGEKSREKTVQDDSISLGARLAQVNRGKNPGNSGGTSQPEEKGGAGNPAAGQHLSGGTMTGDTVRVSVNKLDSLMAQLSELFITKIHAAQLHTQIRRAREITALWQKSWLVTRNSYSWLARQDGEKSVHPAAPNHYQKELAKVLAYVNFSQDSLRELSGTLNALQQQHQSDVMRMSLVIDRLEDEIKRLRMLPMSLITDSFGRMVRDLAQSAGKKAVLEIRGGEVELDKGVLEKIKDPILHLLRNAVDHGIEPPDVRMAAGKPSQGTIILSAETSGREVAISVSDDGSGLDIDAICKAATRRGITNVREMTHAEIVQLIYTAGFSTSPMITDISGRGIGLDVVRRNIENLHGKISVDWKPGAGTVFTLTLPLVLTSTRALLVRAADQWFAIPLNTIERILFIKPGDITSVGANDTIRFDGQQIMLVHLSNTLELGQAPDDPDRQSIPVVILSSAARCMAFEVDEFGDEQEVVVKALGKQFISLGGIAGAHLMGNGSVLLVLNVADLIKLGLRGGPKTTVQPGAANRKKPATEIQKRNILIVDDSITTRTLEKNILEAAGYSVRLAINGMEALNAIKKGDLPDLIISDVAMPRMDGLDLTKRIKGEARTAKIPLILVTSMDSAEDKARGIDCGADAYIVKSSFDQGNLLETIQQLI